MLVFKGLPDSYVELPACSLGTLCCGTWILGFHEFRRNMEFSRIEISLCVIIVQNHMFQISTKSVEYFLFERETNIYTSKQTHSFILLVECSCRCVLVYSTVILNAIIDFDAFGTEVFPNNYIFFLHCIPTH